VNVPFNRHAGFAAPLPHQNLDTDQIIPARFLTGSRSDGFEQFLFHDLRHDSAGRAKAGFVLDEPSFRAATVLVAGDNFGCGSSREQAVWSLQDTGYRAIVAPSFGEIFADNAATNGLLAIQLEADQVSRLLQSLADGPREIAIDLPQQTLTAEALGCIRFPIDAFFKDCLVHGMTALDLTLTRLGLIEAFERTHKSALPWAFARPDTKPMLDPVLVRHTP